MSLRHTLGRPPRLLAAAVVLLAAGCALQAGQERRPPRTADVTLHLLSQSGFQGEIIPCG